MSATHILELKGVSKHFGGFVAVDNVDLTINQGEIFGFLGPNGAGKSTTIKLILDAGRASAGTISLFGRSNRRTPATHQRIGYLSGDMIIDEDLTGSQYLDFVQSLYHGDKKAVAAARQHLIEVLELDVDVKVSRYSRGNKQKVGLVAALMHNPELLILDEPSSGLDPLMQEVFIKLIQEYRQAGGTVFMSSHSLDEVQRLCDRVAFIRSGKLVGVASIDELNKTSLKQVVVMADKEELAKLKHQVGGLKGLALAETGNTARLNTTLYLTYTGPMQPLLKLLAAHKLDDLTIREPELEEIFMTYYQTDEAKS